MSAVNGGGLLATAPQGGWCLAQGVELLGEFEGAAFSERPWLLRRGDGQVIQMSRLLYAIASYLDGKAASVEIAAAVSARTGRSLSAENVEYLISHKLVPLGVVGDALGDTALPRSKALLALRFRVRVFPERAHRGISLFLRPLFAPTVVLSMLVALIGTDVTIALTRRTGPGAASRELASHPALLLLLTGLLFASAAIHEMGHATAVRYGGGNPGVMGVGIYLVWPVFYTDVSDAYRLDRKGRLRTDLGGVYFNAVAITLCSCIYLSTHYLPLLIFIVVGHLQILWQFMPFVRMDGYWVLSDLVGVPNLFAFMGPILVSFGRTKDPRMVARLNRIKPWARRVITVWVGLTIAILALNAAFIVWTGPRVLTTDLVASRGRALSIGSEFAHANVIGGLNDITSLVLLLIPAAGIMLIAALLSMRTARVVIRWWPEHRARAASLGAVGLAALAVFAFEFVPKEITRPLEGGLGGSYWNPIPSPSTAPTQSASPPAPDGLGSLGDRLPTRGYQSSTNGHLPMPLNPRALSTGPVSPSSPITSPSATRTTGVATPTTKHLAPTVHPPAPGGSATPTVRTTPSTNVPGSAIKPSSPPPVTVRAPAVTVTTPPVTVPPVTVKTPTVTTPPVTVPPVTVKTPAVTVTTPLVTVPPVTVKTPTVTTPTVTTPTVTTPTVTVPPVTVKTPAVTVTTPAVTVPPVTVKAAAAALKASTVSVPTSTVKTPAVTVPTDTVPPVPAKAAAAALKALTVTTPPVTVTTPSVTLPSGL